MALDIEEFEEALKGWIETWAAVHLRYLLIKALHILPKKIAGDT